MESRDRHSKCDPQRKAAVRKRAAALLHLERANRALCAFVLCVGAYLMLPHAAQAAEDLQFGTVTVSADGSAAIKEKCDFGLADYTRFQVGSNRNVDETYIGYAYYVGADANQVVAIYTNKDAVVYIPQDQATAVEYSLKNSTQEEDLAAMLAALDQVNSKGGVVIDANKLKWHVTFDTSITVGNAVYTFDHTDKNGRVYATVIGVDGSDITDAENPLNIGLQHAATAQLKPQSDITIIERARGFAAIAEFFQRLDPSPLWVTLKTTFTAIVFIFILGLLAAYWLVRLPSRMQDIFDAIFTIPMVLPPTVCGFLLLLLLGKNTGLGRFFIDVGFPLIFSWPATVIAAVVVAFPLMYRSARGAFENLDNNLLDAARTLGWSNKKIFFRLMLPLSWPSIAAGTVLAFARALGEFGATLFIAGNYAGVTQTIPIAIYYQWMNGNTDVALFWTGVVILFSFAVIVFINLWSKRTTRYKRPIEQNDEVV